MNAVDLWVGRFLFVFVSPNSSWFSVKVTSYHNYKLQKTPMPIFHKKYFNFLYHLQIHTGKSDQKRVNNNKEKYFYKNTLFVGYITKYFVKIITNICYPWSFLGIMTHKSSYKECMHRISTMVDTLHEYLWVNLPRS